MLLFKFRRKEAPWEVVDNKFVDPVPTYLRHEKLNIHSVCESDLRRTYIFDIGSRKKGRGYAGHPDLHHALSFSREQLLEEAAKLGYNALVIEGWQLTILRRAKHHRIEVRYNGRPARVSGKLPSTRSPPCIGILQA